MSGPVVPAWAWKNPPAAPIGCTSCGAVAGMRCTRIGDDGPTAALRGNRPVTKVHKPRAIAVAAWFDNRDSSNVADFARYQARRATRTSATPAIITPSR